LVAGTHPIVRASTPANQATTTCPGTRISIP